jgi:hypothetical protein
MSYEKPLYRVSGHTEGFYHGMMYGGYIPSHHLARRRNRGHSVLASLRVRQRLRVTIACVLTDL